MTKYNPEAAEAAASKAAQALTDGDKTEYHKAMRSMGDTTVAEQAQLLRTVQVMLSEHDKDNFK